MHHFDQMFYHARRHVNSNTFVVYKKHIIKQYELYEKLQVKSDSIEAGNQNPHVKKSRINEVSDYTNSNST